MISGIGIDIVETQRIQKAITRFGTHFLERVFAPEEITYCQNKKKSWLSFAARFCAKEAFLKAIGTGLRYGFHFTDITTINNHLGKPYIKKTDKLTIFFQQHAIAICHLSLSHTKTYAMAHVILEKETNHAQTPS